MATESRHLGIAINRPAAEVYDYVSNPANLAQWAAGLGGSIELVEGRWIADTPMGRAAVAFVERNPYGVVDHWVSLATGETFYNPMRVIAGGGSSEAGGGSSEVVFTLRCGPGMSEDEFEADTRAVVADLATLKRLLEAG